MISIVIPIYNEEDNLDMLYRRLTSASCLWNDTYEVILVDDGSYDRSLTMMREIAGKDSHFRIVKLTRNFGHQAAISAGIEVAVGAAVVIMDGDLQDPPEELPRFLEKLREGYDVVYAIRTKRKENIFKRAAYDIFYRLLRLISDIDIPLDSGDFCVISRKIANILINQIPEKNRFLRGLRAFAGCKQIGVHYERAERAAGQPKYTFRKLLKLALDGLFDFSTFPLRLSMYFGMFISLISFVLGMFFIIHRIFDFKIFGHSPADVPGLASLAVGMFFLGGIMLIMLGIIGEYIGRMYIEVKRRPFYLIEEIYTKGSSFPAYESKKKEG